MMKVNFGWSCNQESGAPFASYLLVQPTFTIDLSPKITWLD